MNNSIHNFLPSYNPYNQSSQGTRSESFQQTAQSQKESNISITTAEGDVVTISSSYAMAMAYAFNKEATPVSYSQSISAMSMESSSFAMSIQGDLSDEEIQDIKHLLHDLSKISKAFFQGDTDRALRKVFDIGDMGSVSQLSASFSYSEQIATSHAVSSFPAVPEGDALAGFTDLKEMLEDEFIEDIKFMDLLRARWQQLREALEQNNESSKIASPLEMLPENDDDIPAAEQMLNRAKNTVRKHPRLSPFIVPVAQKAIDDAAKSFNQEEEKAVNPGKLHKDFLKKWQDWVQA